MLKLEKKLLHYTGKAIADFNMIRTGDRIMVCLSGGKDSYTLLFLLNTLRLRSGNRFELMAYTLDQGQPGWNDDAMREYLARHDIHHVIEKRDTYTIVLDKVPAGKTYCSLCSRLRRGNIYRFAREHGMNKIALGHHRDDLIESLLMSVLYSGEVRSMPPKLLTDDKRHIVIRPMVYCQEKDIARYAAARKFPIIPCNLCGSQKNMLANLLVGGGRARAHHQHDHAPPGADRRTGGGQPEGTGKYSERHRQSSPEPAHGPSLPRF